MSRKRKIKLKILPSRQFDEEFDELFISSKQRIPVVFNRRGIYRTPDMCWEEDGKGNAYPFRADMFDFYIELADAHRLNKRQIRALRAVVKNKLANRQQSRLYYMAECCYEVRSIYLNRRMSFREWLGPECSNC